MFIEIKVPDIGVDEVEITEIMVKTGDKVEVEQSLVTVEGDKASMEIPSPQAGVVKEIKVGVGDKIETGKLIMIFETNLTNETDTRKSGKDWDQNAPDASSKCTESLDADECDDGVTDIIVKIGEKVITNQTLITTKREQVSIEVPIPSSDKLKEILIKSDHKLKIASLIILFSVDEETYESLECNKSAEVSLAFSKTLNKKSIKKFAHDDSKDKFSKNVAYVHASPVVRRLARELDVNLLKIKGSGRKDRILREDVQAYLKSLAQDSKSMKNSEISGNMRSWPKVDFKKFGDIEEIDIGRIQKISGANLSRNWLTIPHVTHFDKVDITDLEAFRKQQNHDAVTRNLDLKLTPTAFIMKAVGVALQKMPNFNSSISEDGQRLTLKKYINIGVAVNTSNGLVVPVFKDVNKKSITELSRELFVIAKKARGSALSASEMQGGCFTISSLGGIGTTYFSPIVNAPEVAILGVSKSDIEPFWNGKEFIPRLMMPISLSFDHRVIDGADGAYFIKIISNILSDIRYLVM